MSTAEEAAFPIQHENGFTQTGMTLRDYFASHALAGLIGAHKSMFYNPSAAAKASYEAADAMLAERNKATGA